MSLQEIKRGLVIPPWPDAVTVAPSFSVVTLNDADEACAAIIAAPKTGNVRAIWSSLGVGTGADRTIGLYTVDTSTGSPTTPPTAYNTNSFAVRAMVAGDSNKMVSSGNFGTDCPVVKGDIMAVCWIAPSSSPGNTTVNFWGDAQPGFPYRSAFTTGAWVKGGFPGNILLEYDDGTLEVPLGCTGYGDASGNLVTTVTFSNSSTPDVVGARFKFPGPTRVNGGWIWADLDGDAKIYLVDEAWDGTSGDALAEATIDSDIRSTTGGSVYQVELDEVVALTADTWYRFVIEPSSGTNLSVYYYGCVGASQLAAQPMGANFHYTSAKDPNDNTDWTNFNNGTDGYRVLFAGLFIDQIADDASGGGGSASSHAFVG